MAAFADVDEYQTAVQRALEGLELAAVAFQLDAATEDIRDYLGQYVELVEDDEVTLYGTGTRALLLPQAPVVAVNSVTVDDEEWDEGDDFTVDAERAILYRTDSWRIWPATSTVVVDYDHGEEPIPANIKRATIALARLNLYLDARQGAVSSETVGPFSYTIDTSADAAEREAILRSVARRAKRQVPTA